MSRRDLSLPSAGGAVSVSESRLQQRAERLCDQLAVAAANGEFRGTIRADAAVRTMYASNASICYLKPAAVARPTTADDVAVIVREAAAVGLPITPRGAGSSVAGQSLGPGLILDCSAHLNRILAIDPGAQTVTVEPGLVLDRLNAALRVHGLWFPPDPSSAGFCTIGGMIANNSGGAHSLRYGTTKHYVQRLDLVLADGSRVTIAAPPRTDLPAAAVVPVSVSPTVGRVPIAPATAFRAGELAQRIGDLLRANRDTVAAERPRSFRSSCGYNLFEVETPDGMIDLTRLLCGSEGTLGVIVAATLRVIRPPAHRVGLCLGFADETAAFRCVPAILARFSPSTIQALSRELVAAAARADHGATSAGFRVPTTLAQLFVIEFDGDDRDELNRTARHCLETFGPPSGLAVFAELAETPEKLAEIWLVRKSAAAVLSRITGAERPTRWIEDGAVPPARLAEFVAGLRELFATHGIDAALFGHAGQGLLHFSPRMAPHAPDYAVKLAAIADAHATLLRAVDGVPSGEHGDGRLRSALIPRFFPATFPLMTAAKQAFDPAFQFNPGVKIPLPLPLPLPSGAISSASAAGTLDDDDLSGVLRYGPSYRHAETHTRFDAQALRDAVELCHGCGQCRTYCPVVELGHEEEHLPRAKANVLRDFISGRLTAGEAFGTGDGGAPKAVVDHCLNCGLCLSHCPTHVDIPGISAAFQAEWRHYHGGVADTVAGRSPQLAEWVARADWIATTAGIWPAAANALLALKPVRRVMETVAGIASTAVLPEFRGAPPATWPRPVAPRSVIWRGREVRDVTVFPSCEGRSADRVEYEALGRILTAMGLFVRWLPDAPCCGRPQISMGTIDAAQANFVRLRRQIIDEWRAGRPVLILTPSCLPPFHVDLLRPSTAIAAAAVPSTQLGAELSAASAWCVDACRFVADVADQTELPAAVAIGVRAVESPRVAVHAPCSLRAVEHSGSTPMDLLRRFGFTNCAPITDAPCCGALGTFSLKSDHIAEAARIGARMKAEIARLAPTQIASSAGTCRRWLTQQTALPTVHPLALISAYLPPPSSLP